MISNLADYFRPEQEIFLDSITYERLDKTNKNQGYMLNCIDGLEVRLAEDNVQVLVKRVVRFEPQELFELSISFGATLKFCEEKRKEYDWKNVNLADEFKNNGNFVLNNLMNRMSLLIAEIISSCGQIPIILPPGIGGKVW